MASDPNKLMAMRAIHRARTACEATGNPACTPSDPRYYNLSRLVQKNIEHTWGISVFHYGKEADKDWGNEAFHGVLAANNSNFDKMISSWVEQVRMNVLFMFCCSSFPYVPSFFLLLLVLSVVCCFAVLAMPFDAAKLTLAEPCTCQVEYNASSRC
jgi:hypothetical protein